MMGGSSFFLAVIFSFHLCIKVAAEVPLDMAPDAVDDMYEGCTKEAQEKLVFNVLKEELNHSSAFQSEWRSAQTPACTKLPVGTKEHTTALRTYVTSNDHFRTTVNNAVFSYGTNATTYEEHFHFKALHFLLMDSMRLLHPGTCKIVYAFSEPKFSAQNGSRVRFGRFYLAYPSMEILKEVEIDGEIVLSINTCYFVNLGDNICHNDHIILLSPTEEFTVEDVKTVKEENDVSYQMISLKHSQLKSKRNCYMFSRSSDDVPSQWLVLVLLTSSFFILR